MAVAVVVAMVIRDNKAVTIIMEEVVLEVEVIREIATKIREVMPQIIDGRTTMAVATVVEEEEAEVIKEITAMEEEEVEDSQTMVVIEAHQTMVVAVEIQEEVMVVEDLVEDMDLRKTPWVSMVTNVRTQG
jgi:hypothetical protein